MRRIAISIFSRYVLLLQIWLSCYAKSSRTWPDAQEILTTDNALPESAYERQHPAVPVLGYVTPWNSRGNQLVEEFRAKFDIVAPVWYTVHANEDDAKVAYEIKGGPPSEEDAEWYKRLQQPSSGAGPLKITQRFILDSWSNQDYKELLSNYTRVSMLAETITLKVEEMNFDGIVFESAVTSLFREPLKELSSSLHHRNKILVVVLPPLRTAVSTGDEPFVDPYEQQNTMILQNFPSLAGIADYFTIMTYDMSGPGGRDSGLIGFDFPEASPYRSLERGALRQPGPNTNAEFVCENLDAFVQSSYAHVKYEYQAENQVSGAACNDAFCADSSYGSRKFLMGLPLYGYTYPIFWLDIEAGHLVREATDSAYPILRGAGKPITMPEVLELLKKHDPEIDEFDDKEFYFDYVESDGPWRVFMPTSTSMRHILSDMEEALADEDISFVTAGVALWEVGQSSKELLAVL